MACHWQRRPLLVRRAIPGFRSPVDLETVFGLAARDDVESRLVTAFRNRWRLARGPFDRAALPPLDRPGWTLLVQGADLHLPEIHGLMRRFRFVGDARLDDVMISVASDGGGVGPHLDAYDVFLLQASGRRRWRIAPTGFPRRPPPMREDVPLKMMQPFQATRDWILDPGDMLYLPPGWAHDGTAVGPCATFSIGFRAPSRLEFLRAFLADVADDPEGADPRFSDRGLAATRRPAELPATLQQTLREWAGHWRPSRAQVDRYIGRFLTEPKPNVWFDAPPRAQSLEAFRQRLAGGRLELDPRTRMLYRGRQLFVNGELFATGSNRCLRKLADVRCLDGASLELARQDSEIVALLHQWWTHGWIRHHKRD